MEFRSGTETYYRQMLELQDKLRKSEEERLKLEEKFNEIMQQSRDAEYERLRIMRHKYHKFLEEDKARQERNENILRTLDRIESRAKQLAAKTDRFKVFRKQYFENYLKQIPKQKQQTFDLNTQSTNRPQYQNESVRRKLFADKPTTVNENVETKLALLEKYLRDNFDNFPRDFPSSTTAQNGLYTGKPTNVLYDNKNYLDDASDSKESQESQVDKYSPSKMNGHYQTPGELLGNKIEQELDRLRNKKENELNNNSLDVQELNPEQVINDYKKLVSKSEEKFGLRNGIPKKTEVHIDEAYKLHMDIPYNDVDKKEESNLLEEEENSEDTKPPTDISLNLSSSTSQLKEQFDESKKDEIEILPQINNEEYLENSSKSEEITSIEKQKVQPINVQIKESNVVTKPILSQSEEITKTPEISNNEEKLEEQNIEYDSKLDALNYSEQENIQSNQQFIENPQSNEFGEAVSNQPYSKEQKYLPETFSEENYTEEPYATQQNEIQEQYNDEVQSDFKQNYENGKAQDDTEAYNEQQYESPEQQYESPKQQYENPEQQYESPKQQYESPEQQNESPEEPFQQKELYENSGYENTEHEFEASEKQPYVNPEHQFEAPEKQYPQSEQQYESSEQYMNPEQQYVAPEQYINPEQPYVNPEEEYVNAEQQQYVNPEQQEYPPENYDQQYPQQTYPEGEYDPQSYPEVYETQQPENYDAQQYPQQQYPEGYDPQQYTEGQQLEYDQQYPQGEGFQDQQYVGNAEYDPQGQYPENLYQTGQEYLQGEQNVDLQYEAEQQQPDYPDGYTGQEIEQNNVVDENETVTESDAVAAVSEQKPLEDNKPLVQKKLPNLADMLDTDTSESVKPDSKVSDSDFDFSNTKT